MYNWIQYAQNIAFFVQKIKIKILAVTSSLKRHQALIIAMLVFWNKGAGKQDSICNIPVVDVGILSARKAHWVRWGEGAGQGW